jgi:TolB protein
LVADITGHAFMPVWSPDGTEIAFYTWGSDEAEGGGEVFVVSADGGTPEQLTDFPGADNRPSWSPDGLAIAYQSQGPRGEGIPTLWIVSRDGVGGPWSDPVQLTDFPSASPLWAPDGQSLLCITRSGWALVSRDGEVLWRYDPTTVGLQGLGNLQFSPDGSRIYLSSTHEDGSKGVWWIPADGGDATKVVAFDDPSVTVLPMITVGLENLYLTIAKYESDIWVMDLEW